MPAKTTDSARKAADADKARRACKDFEAILLYHLLSSMRSASQSEEEMDSGFGGDVFRSMMDEQLSLALARAGGIGLSSMMEKSLGLDQITAKQAPESGLQELGSAERGTAGAATKLTPKVAHPHGPDRLYDEATPVVPQAPVGPVEDGPLEAASPGLSGSQEGEHSSRAEQAEQAGKVAAPVDISATALPDTALARIRRYEPTIKAAATVFGLSTDLLKAVIIHESGGNPRAVSRKGAKGLMQLTDGTARDLGVTNPFDPVQNIFGGARFLARLLKSFGGNLELALASYNAGMGAVLKYGGIPPFKETQDYVSRIVASLGDRIRTAQSKG
jgi:Rod binding domain-containing protein